MRTTWRPLAIAGCALALLSHGGTAVEPASAAAAGTPVGPAQAGTPCEARIAALKVRLKRAEAAVDKGDLNTSGARRHYKIALSAHRAFDEPTCLSEIARAEAALK